MAKFGVVLVSHSGMIADGLRDLVNEMNDGSVPVVAAGGTSDGRIGTEVGRIMEAIEEVADCEHILIYADLGSSVLSANMAMDEISDEDEELAEKIQLVDCPMVEGALAGVVQATMADTVEEVIEASVEAKNVSKIS